MYCTNARRAALTTLTGFWHYTGYCRPKLFIIGRRHHKETNILFAMTEDCTLSDSSPIFEVKWSICTNLWYCKTFIVKNICFSLPSLPLSQRKTNSCKRTWRWWSRDWVWVFAFSSLYLCVKAMKDKNNKSFQLTRRRKIQRCTVLHWKSCADKSALLLHPWPQYPSPSNFCAHTMASWRRSMMAWLLERTRWVTLYLVIRITIGTNFCEICANFFETQRESTIIILYVPCIISFQNNHV